MFDEKREQLNLCARLLQKCYTILRFHCLSIPGYFCDAGIGVVLGYKCNIVITSRSRSRGCKICRSLNIMECNLSLIPQAMLRVQV